MNPAPQNTQAPTFPVLMAGGKRITVTKHDGSTEEVLVRISTLRECPTLLGLIDDEAGMIEFCTRQPKGWADSLTDDSIDAVLEKSIEVNRPTLSRFAIRKARMAEFGAAVMQVAVARAEAAMKSIGAPNSPKSAPSAQS